MKKWLYLLIVVWGLLGAYYVYYKNWAALEAIFTWMLAGGLFFAILQVYQARKSTNAQIALGLFNKLRSEKSKETLNLIFRLTPEDIGYLYETPISNHRQYQEWKNRIHGLLDKYEMLGALVNNNIIEKSLATQAFGGTPALKCWYKLIEYIRKETCRRGYFLDNYEAFVRLSLDYFKKAKISIRFDGVDLVTELQKAELHPRNVKQIEKDRKKK